ncbi:MAG: hypothetical protein M3O71_07330 [Bacteroidota bacterium]|nr:hypothetical protein [Bacteroidota bacterium]
MSSEVLQDPIIFAPDNFQADVILQDEPGNKTLKSNLTDAMHYLLHTIIQMENRQDMRKEFIETGYFNLNATHLKEICGTHYRDAGRILEKHNVISIDPSYQVGLKSKGYCLIGNYASSENKVVKLVDKGGTKKRLIAWREKQDNENKKELAKIEYITKWYDKDRLTVDVQDAHDFVEFYRYMLLEQIPRDISENEKNNLQNRINQRYNAAIGVIKRIIAGDFKLYRMGKDNRLHSTITSVMKEFRSFLRFDCQPLIGIDVKSCQPYLLTRLLKSSTYNLAESDLNIASIYPILYSTLQEDPNLIRQIENIIMLLTFTSDPITKRTFFNIDWTKDFYQELIDLEAGLYPSENKMFRNRESVKRTMMFILYATKENKYRIPEWKRFEALFPIEGKLVRFFDALSRLHNNSFLPILLQRMESKLILDVVCREISDTVPDAPIIPIHDSILTTPAYVRVVEDIIKNTMEKTVGINPGLKQESISAEEVLNKLKEISQADYAEIISDLSKQVKDRLVNCKDPLIVQTPRWKNKQVISSRYINNSTILDNYWQQYNDDE